MKHRDARVHLMFDHLRLALDQLEQIASNPYRPPETVKGEARTAVPPTPAVPPAPNREPTPHKLLFTVKEAKLALGISTTTIYALIKQHKLVALKLGHKTLIKAETIQALVDALPAMS